MVNEQWTMINKKFTISMARSPLTPES